MYVHGMGNVQHQQARRAAGYRKRCNEMRYAEGWCVWHWRLENSAAQHWAVVRWQHRPSQVLVAEGRTLRPPGVMYQAHVSSTQVQDHGQHWIHSCGKQRASEGRAERQPHLQPSRTQHQLRGGRRLGQLCAPHSTACGQL